MGIWLKIIGLSLLGIGWHLSGQSQVTSICKEWEFQRLSSGQVGGEIKNQGSDWASQYQVEHVSSTGVLSVSADTLNNEFARLKQGKWEKVTLPHTAYVEDYTVLHQWQGVCYYRRTFQAPVAWKEKEVWIEFKGAMHLADVWINGQHVMQHAGGYLPFVVELNSYLDYGRSNEILVRLDNRDNGLIPPGKPLNSLDFCYYSGLYRGVDLIVKNKQHITHPVLANRVAGGGIFVRYPLVTENKAEIQVGCELENKDTLAAVGLTLQHSLYEIDGLFGEGRRGKCVAVKSTDVLLGKEAVQEVNTLLTVEHPALWFPDAPYLYELSTELMSHGRVIDRQNIRIGIRKIEMSRDNGFLINGKSMRLVGTNRHMEYPYVGNALPDNAQFRDIYQIRTSGYNIVRLGHYPQDPSVLKACDELGLLVIEPIPGWQYFNRDSVFLAHTFRDVRELIRRDRNHPSIVMWETTLNESWPPAEWKDEVIRIAHEEYPGDQCYTSGDAYGYEGFDVSYNDWQEGFHRPNKTSNPGFIREYYDYEFGGHYSTSRITRGAGEKALLQNAWNAQWSHNRYRKQYPQTMGDAVWSMYDYNRGCCDNVCYSGVADLFRLPKYSFYFFRSQVRPGEKQPGGEKQPELFIASRWEDRSDRIDTIQVYGNVDEVELYVNDRLVARQKPDQGKDSEYISRTDGGNCRHLVCPPFTFNVRWEAGTLKAIGYIQGQKVTEYVVHTPGKPVKLDISYFESGCPAEKQDLLIVYVRLLDIANTLCPVNGIEVCLEAKGGEIVGPAKYTTEAGIASFLVRTGDAASLKLNAFSQGLSQNRKIVLK